MCCESFQCFKSHDCSLKESLIYFHLMKCHSILHKKKGILWDDLHNFCVCFFRHNTNGSVVKVKGSDESVIQVQGDQRQAFKEFLTLYNICQDGEIKIHGFRSNAKLVYRKFNQFTKENNILRKLSNCHKSNFLINRNFQQKLKEVVNQVYLIVNYVWNVRT